MAIVSAPTITRLPDGAAGAVLVTGSHGGAYCAHVAADALVRAAIFHDAGIGLDQAGVAALALLAPFGLAAAAASHLTCRIGDVADMMARGRISRANAPARALGVVPGMACDEAAHRMQAAPLVRAALPPRAESRAEQEDAVPCQRRRLVLVDSASLVDPARDAGAVVVSGSHGELIAGDPAAALKAQAFAAVFNDAGRGIDDAGISRLPALDARGIAAAAVAASTARIGDARSSLEQGVVSAVNARAAALGAAPGMPAMAAVRGWLGIAS